MSEPVTKELFDFAMDNINDGLNEIKSKLDQIHTVDSKAIANTNKLVDHERRIKGLEGNQSKIVWAIITSIAGGVMTWIIAGGLKK